MADELTNPRLVGPTLIVFDGCRRLPDNALLVGSRARFPKESIA